MNNNTNSFGSKYSVKGTEPKGIALENIKGQIFKLNSHISELKKANANPKLIEEKEQYRSMLMQVLLSLVKNRNNGITGGKRNKRKTKRRQNKKRRTYKK